MKKFFLLSKEEWLKYFSAMKNINRAFSWGKYGTAPVKIWKVLIKNFKNMLLLMHVNNVLLTL